MFIDREAAAAWLERYRLRLQRDGALDKGTRIDSMLSVNPLYVLRNYLAQRAIEAAQNGDFSQIGTLFEVLTDPFNYQPGRDAYAAQPPAWATKIEVSCSS